MELYRVNQHICYCAASFHLPRWKEMADMVFWNQEIGLRSKPAEVGRLKPFNDVPNLRWSSRKSFEHWCDGCQCFSCTTFATFHSKNHENLFQPMWGFVRFSRCFAHTCQVHRKCQKPKTCKTYWTYHMTYGTMEHSSSAAGGRRRCPLGIETVQPWNLIQDAMDNFKQLFGWKASNCKTQR